MQQKIWKLAMVAVMVVVVVAESRANGPAAVPGGGIPSDSRLGPLKDLNGHFLFDVPPTQDVWNARSEQLKHRLATVLGLWPEPAKTPLKPVVHGRKDMGDYSVAKVYFESVPGFYVTGNLYLPSKIEGKVPAIISPHGHWNEGRFYQNDRVAFEIASGAERFLSGGRSPMQSRSVQLARMGCIVFHYDMIGYADAKQISYEVAHRFSKQREHLKTGDKWGYFSPKAEGHYQSIMGMQTWNSIRALDFLCSMPEVDQTRLGVTGASGGGTQTFLLAALDDRIDLSIPVVMVSTRMQGGCTCENATGLRIGTGNVEIASLFAPGPQGVISANDWTVDFITKGFPEMKKLYELTGKPGNIELASLTHFGHNYNYVSRSRMYEWVNKHFKLGHTSPILEKEFQLMSPEELTVWDDKHRKPVGGEEFEVALLNEQVQSHWKQVLPLAESNMAQLRNIMQKGWEVVIGRNWNSVGKSSWKMTGKNKDFEHFIEMPGMIENGTYGESLPVVFLYPKVKWNGETELVISGEGKSVLYDSEGKVKPKYVEMLKKGATVMGGDLLYQGEFLADGQEMKETRRVGNSREAACYTLGYNHSLCAQRIHDVMTSIHLLRTFEEGPSKVNIHAGPEISHIALAAAAMAGKDHVADLNIDSGDFQFGAIDNIRDPDFLPGALKYGGLRGLRFLNGLEIQ